MSEINSKYYAELYKQELKDRISKLAVTPSLTIIVGKSYSPPSKIYVNNKLKVANELGIKTNLIEVEWINKSKEELLEELESYTYECFQEGSAIVIQDPFPHITQKEIGNLLEDYYMLDVDGFSNIQKQMLIENDNRALIPATAKGVIKLLKYIHGNLSGLSIGIFSRSNLIGKPLLHLALNEDMTPRVIHSKSFKHDKKFTDDIIVTGCGKRKIFNSNDIVNSECTIIDCSMYKEEGVKDVGDCNKEDILDWFPNVNIASGYNHSGLFTVLALMDNVIKIYELMEV